ncbi:MAG: SMI1/KNR4 family protein, partial [Cyanobacteria bacterium P01_F01_bin.153]
VVFKCIHTPSSDLADDGMCETFFYIPKHDGAGNVYNLLWNYRCYLDRMPKNLIPVAGTGGGNIICISALGKDYGKVYCWDHELEEEPMGEEECTYSNISLIGDNFLHFLDSLELDRIPD